MNQGLIGEEDLEAANERLVDSFNSGEILRPRLLEIMIYELHVLKEDDLLEHLSKDSKLGLIDLSRVKLNLPQGVTAEECLATGTIPFDRLEDRFFLATTYYYSNPVKDYWEKRLEGEIEWFATSIESLSSGMEDLQGETGGPVGATQNEVSAT